MERPHYKLIAVFLLTVALSVRFPGIYANVIHQKSTEVQTSVQQIQPSFKQQVYRAYISGKMDGWKTAIDGMEQQKSAQPSFLAELISYQYGYVAWCLGTEKKDDARHYLSLLEKNLEKLKSGVGETAEYHAYTAAAFGFKIGLNNWRAPFFGPKSMAHAEKAIEKDSRNFHANMEMGNIWNHMPAVFGGSDEKALEYYLTALEIMEKQPAETRKENWSYLNLLAVIGQLYQAAGKPESAQKYFEQALMIEPGFIWVKTELLPSLNTD